MEIRNRMHIDMHRLATSYERTNVSTELLTENDVVCFRCGAAVAVVSRVVARVRSTLSSVAIARHYWRAFMVRAKINPPST